MNGFSTYTFTKSSYEIILLKTTNIIATIPLPVLLLADLNFAVSLTSLAGVQRASLLFSVKQINTCRSHKLKRDYLKYQDLKFWLLH